MSEAVLGKLAAKDNPQTMLGVFAQRRLRAPVFESVPADGLWIALEASAIPATSAPSSARPMQWVPAASCLIGNCVDAYARETVRATMGSIFNVPLVRMSLEECLPGWRAGPATSWARISPRPRISARAATVPRRCCSWAARGRACPPELSAACTRLVRIPMAGRLDSLNLAVATALMLYEIRRGRLKL